MRLQALKDDEARQSEDRHKGCVTWCVILWLTDFITLLYDQWAQMCGFCPFKIHRAIHVRHSSVIFTLPHRCDSVMSILTRMTGVSIISIQEDMICLSIKAVCKGVATTPNQESCTLL